MTFPIVDCHAHLADSRIWNERWEILADSREHGLAALLPNAARACEWDKVLMLAEEQNICSAIGIHPFWPEEWNDGMRRRMLAILDEPSSRHRICAIGEIGLDGIHRDTLPLQEKAFAEQLEIAVKYGLPVCMHNRKAWQSFFGIVKEMKLSHIHGYMHNFTSSREVARQLLDLGLHISFCSPVTYAEGDRLRNVAAYVPMDYILTETDCPDLPPQNLHGQLTRPWHALYPLQAIATAHEIKLQDAAEQIHRNFIKCFKQT